ncbi:UDP-glucosyltransferase 2 [Amyelois transitella]|uniref:UDP-glucosyltransferase 2 n=1 Tax=Amyelois transitella TaxID=680683 RepID=UPI00298FFD17|nr:UDP-glucosyltransferase 2 [Amyelois transitella]
MAELLFFIISAFILSVDSARILAVFPMPSISHQVVFRPLVLELVKRGHDVVLITPDPSFPKGGGPINLTEIDMHDIAYKPWIEYLPEEYKDKLMSIHTLSIKSTLEITALINTKVVEVQLLSELVQELINDKTQHFDLLLVEACLRPTLVFSHIFKAPVIQVSSAGPIPYNLQTVGAPMHPILYPFAYSKKLSNLTLYDKYMELYNFLINQYVTYRNEKIENDMLRRTLGSDVPTVSELSENVDMLFLNVHSLWESNRPVPPNVLYLGALHIKQEKELPKDLKSYLDSSKNGVIYMSFGTNVDPSMIPPQVISSFVDVFAELRYNVLWKWHTEDVPRLPKNVKISKWLPQRDLLMHPNVKLFITQGGLQSTDEAIAAAVPLIGIPMLGDQWYNVEKYVHHGIGVRLDIETIDADKFKDAIDTVINDKSYLDNIRKLKSLMYDQPQTPLEKAVWWTEYVLRHGGRHLRSPAANLPWTVYYEIELLFYLLLFVIGARFLLVYLLFRLYKFVRGWLSKRKLKTN